MRSAELYAAETDRAQSELGRRDGGGAAVSRPWAGVVKGRSPAGKTRFLASLRNDSGGGISAFALPGTPGFLASLRNDRSKAVISTAGRDLLLSGQRRELPPFVGKIE